MKYKSIGLKSKTHKKLLKFKHDCEKSEGRVISFDEIIMNLLIINNKNKNKKLTIT